MKKLLLITLAFIASVNLNAQSPAWVCMNVSVDPVYNPEFTGKITSNTPLARGVKLARFLGGYGDPITLLHIKEESKRLEIAKHLYMHVKTYTRMPYRLPPFSIKIFT